MRKLVRSAYEVVADVVSFNPAIETVNLVSYEESSTWRDVLPPGEDAPVPLLLKGLEQDRRPRVLTKVPRLDVAAEKLREIAASLGEHRLLGICSTVRLVGGRSLHIPMMDFMCASSPSNLELLTSLLGNLRLGRGCLLDSGRSYHYYGFRLLSEEDWQRFMGRCLLMSGFADDRYIGHQLVDGHCVLRLSSGKLKAQVPLVVAELP
jgi:hypothetical protein